LEGFLGFEPRVVKLKHKNYRLIGKIVGCTLAFALQLREKAWKNLSQGSRRVPAGMMKTEYTEQM
jgi:hypothetical protein